ncbi:hypothetical protein PIECOFPK_00872 [Mycovorax composti]|jgi:hypothetical protein|uniref:Uncharacterized protein n=1 Tax=Mycovorax composti TaxID=2962693 RepID=A0ABZ2EIL8_9BACT
MANHKRKKVNKKTAKPKPVITILKALPQPVKSTQRKSKK